MNHREIDQSQIVERYLLRGLSAEEEALFEEHLVDCGRCLDRLESAERFRRGLQLATSESPLPAAASERAGWRAALAHFAGIIPAPAFAGVSLLLLALFAVTLYRGIKTERELRRSQTAFQDLQRVQREQQALVESLMRSLREGSGAEDWQSGLPVFALAMAHGNSRGWDQQQPPTPIAVPPSAPWVILSLEVAPDLSLKFYRIRLLDRSNEVRWSDMQMPQDSETLAIGVPRKLLTEGDHLLVLEGCHNNDTCFPASSYFFRVLVPKLALAQQKLLKK